jgi:hypothetical protein
LPFGDAQRLHVERLGLGVAALLVIDRGQVVETGHGEGVALAERLSDDTQCLLVQRFCLVIAIQLEIEPADIVEALGDRGMLGPEGLLANLEGPCVERSGLGGAALGDQEERQVVEAGRDLGMILAIDPLANLQRAPVQGLGLGVAAETKIGQRQIVERRRQARIARPERLGPVDGLEQPRLGTAVVAGAIGGNRRRPLFLPGPGLGRDRRRPQQGRREAGRGQCLQDHRFELLPLWSAAPGRPKRPGGGHVISECTSAGNIT